MKEFLIICGLILSSFGACAALVKYCTAPRTFSAAEVWPLSPDVSTISDDDYAQRLEQIEARRAMEH